MCCATPATAVTPRRDHARAKTLPEEATLHLLNYLDAVSLSQCAQTFSAWRKLASADLLWHRLCRSEFGIDGSKCDYASRWQQEKKRAFANLKLYVDFLDEIFFSLAAFFALVSVFAVFPALLLIKIDGWLTISWTQVFGSIYGLGFLAVMFVLTRLTLLVTVFSPASSLKNCVSYCGVLPLVKCVLVNRDVGWKVTALVAASVATSIVPLATQLFAEGCLDTPHLAVFLAWASSGCALHHVMQSARLKRPLLDVLATCAFVSTSLLLTRVALVSSLPWCGVVAPFGALPWSAMKQSSIQQFMCKGFYARALPSPIVPRRLSAGSDVAVCTTYYQSNPPLASLVLLALKLDGLLSLPWAVVLLDYVAWIANGPLATYTRQLVQRMFREMPIPANLRKL